MYVADLCFSALCNRFFAFLYFVPKFLRDDGFVVVIDDSPLAFIFSESLVIFIGIRSPTQLRHMPDVDDLIQHFSYCNRCPDTYRIRFRLLPGLTICISSRRWDPFLIQDLHAVRKKSASLPTACPTTICSGYSNRFLISS